MQQTDPLPREVDALLRFRLRFEPMHPWAVLLAILCLFCFQYIARYCDLTDHTDDTVIAQGEITDVEEVIARNKRGRYVDYYVVTARSPGGCNRSAAWQESRSG